MRFKSLVVLLLLFSLLSACNDSDKDKAIQKKKYDSSINEVINLENEKLANEGKPEINRTEIGVVVYDKGELIWLLYKVDSKEVRSTYLKKNDKYNLLTANEASDRIDKASEEYKENIGEK